MSDRSNNAGSAGRLRTTANKVTHPGWPPGLPNPIKWASDTHHFPSRWRAIGVGVPLSRAIHRSIRATEKRASWPVVPSCDGTAFNPEALACAGQDNAMTTLADSVMCEVRRRRGPWRRLSASEALPLNTQTEKRCVECRGRVLALRIGSTARIKHAQAHSGCTLGATYDGHGARFHPAAVV
jgi:hypothetical protein